MVPFEAKRLKAYACMNWLALVKHLRAEQSMVGGACEIIFYTSWIHSKKFSVVATVVHVHGSGAGFDVARTLAARSATSVTSPRFNSITSHSIG